MPYGAKEYFEADFSRLLADGETISNVLAVTFDPTGGLEQVSGVDPAIIEDGSVVRVMLHNGAESTKYFVSVKVQTSTDQELIGTTSVTISADGRPTT